MSFLSLSAFICDWQTCFKSLRWRLNLSVPLLRNLSLFFENKRNAECGHLFTRPVDGHGRGVHAGGHGSLLVLEKLPRVVWPLGDDGLRLLETHACGFSTNIEEWGWGIWHQSWLASTSDSFLSSWRSSRLGSVTWGKGEGQLWLVGFCLWLTFHGVNIWCLTFDLCPQLVKGIKINTWQRSETYEGGLIPQPLLGLFLLLQLLPVFPHKHTRQVRPCS